ncbi:MAG: hypothetical protein CM15mP128_0390 [Methanobacteriota archaeon]|nr:MAG: hypothetical protein CM15mP128_0390 [Euryarchaeota archaeon]
MDTETVLQTTMTGASGWFRGASSPNPPSFASARRLRTSEIEMEAQAAGSPPVTMTPGSGTERTVMTSGGGGQWSLDDATRLSPRLESRPF